ncbi:MULTISPECIES: CbiQ family ECF transporter T component [Fusobacterium]|uniref:Cobalt transport protein n=1 Tax=Fusobacterium equinum TaxID=134605 RepID=A0A133N881_9FUSO|nr:MULTISPECIES: CbiQ family ECF transporter T component [Fusobacterium]AVQ17453.1 hypothetical protein C4N16_07885 [Fusobacterium gonidiaformans ATCC 25563]KMV76224.1 hypothetical protein FGAG_01626 [Fusobacterium gonidiaformans ATCC 25563]KXA12484.1 hypothetical protein HMPREF3206_01770 [Fusobacterium equinum]
MLKNKIYLLLFIIIFAINLFFQDWRTLSLSFLFLLCWNIAYNSQFKQQLKRIWILFFFYLSTFVIQLYYHQEGKVLVQLFGFYITLEGVQQFLGNFLRILNLILLSWIVANQKIFHGRFARYQEIIETVIEFVPQVFILFRKKMKIKWFFRYILKKIQEKQ